MSGDLTRQVRQRLESLHTAGIEWLPRVASAAPVLAAPVLQPEPPAPAAASSSPVQAAQAESMSKADKEKPTQRLRELQVLADKVSRCTRCTELASTRTQTVFGVGAIDPDLCFIGEAPGQDEDRQGEPFVGAAGQLLNRIITACGMKREEVYICNILRCRPPGNRLPKPDEAAHCREWLEGTLALVRPKFICCLGACAAQNLLGSTLAIGKLRKRFHDFNGITVMATYHPAYLLRNPAAKKDVWDDMKMLLAKMGRPVPK